MNDSAVEKLRRQFILVTTVSFFVVILVMGGATAFANYASMRSQAALIIDLIIENNGTLPEATVDNDGDITYPGLPLYSTELLYSTRYFAVVSDRLGHPYYINTESIASVSEEAAVAYAEKVGRPNYRLATIDNFFYEVRTNEGGGTIAVFVDYSTQLRINREVLWNTMLICGVTLTVTFIVVVLISSSAIRPEIENARRQRQFITNASHELKTPLAVIRANTEVIELLQGDNEWTQSTMRQVDRMDGLVQNLVMIARSEERESRDDLSEIDVTKVVAASVEPFQSLAHQGHHELVCELEDNVSLVARESAIQQLVTILVDNALKYCDVGGTVSVSLTGPRVGRPVTLVVANTFAEGENVDYSRFFERFYRDDEAHSNQEGYGIGLSVAESICERQRGSIRASWKNGAVAFTCLLRNR
ncbi:MAG: HAMP domain-containing sensor histidine kinase [Coriobacteriales bacterium]|nr:HAMP domain-containing sensor histidine kinase [Coriobacteriales bacterium]